MTTIQPIIASEDLATYPDAVLADVRWYLDGRSGRDAFEAGHLPGAVFVDLERDLTSSGETAAPTAGRHPFPDPDEFASAMCRLGIDDDSTVIAYDDTGGMTAGRLVVMLRMIGRNAAVLDGGLQDWDGELMTGTGTQRDRAHFTTRPWPVERFADADETAALAAGADGVVLDARSAERFTGADTRVDPRPGHIPGAASAPWSATLDPATSRLRDENELRDHFVALGVNDAVDVVTYCGSGVSACMNILAMEQAGLRPARLYVASYSGWSADAARPIEGGPL